MTSKSRTTVRLGEELLKRAQHRCIDEDITFQQLLERAVEDYLKKPMAEVGDKGGKRVRK